MSEVWSNSRCTEVYDTQLFWLWHTQYVVLGGYHVINPTWLKSNFTFFAAQETVSFPYWCFLRKWLIIFTTDWLLELWFIQCLFQRHLCHQTARVQWCVFPWGYWSWIMSYSRWCCMTLLLINTSLFHLKCFKNCEKDKTHHLLFLLDIPCLERLI